MIEENVKVIPDTNDDTITKFQKELNTLQTLRDLDKAFYNEKCTEYDLLSYKYDKLKGEV